MLTPREGTVLYAAQFAAKEPTSELERRTGFRAHTITHTLDGLRARGVISPYSVINSETIGFTTHTMLCSLSSRDNKVARRFEDFLEKHSFIANVQRVGGDFHYKLALLARSTHELKYILDGIFVRFGDILFEKLISSRLESWLFPRAYLAPSAEPLIAIRSTVTDTIGAIDHLDAKILHTLARDGILPSTQIARKLRTPNSTVEYRLKRLERENIISGWVYFISAAALELSEHRLFVCTKRHDPGTTQKLVNWAHQHPAIYKLLRCVGAWDFEIGIEVEHPRLLTKAVQEFYEQFGASLQSVRVLPVYESLKSSMFPFDPESFVDGAKKG